MEIPPYYIDKNAYLARQYESESSQRLSDALTDKLNQLEWMKEHSPDEWKAYIHERNMRQRPNSVEMTMRLEQSEQREFEKQHFEATCGF